MSDEAGWNGAGWGPIVASCRLPARFARPRSSACERRCSAGQFTGMVYEGFGMQATEPSTAVSPALPHTPHLPLQGFIITALQRAVDPAAWGHIRWTAALDPSVEVRRAGEAGCPSSARARRALPPRGGAAPPRSAGRVLPPRAPVLEPAARPSPRSAAHVSSGGCAATGCCARHPRKSRTKEARKGWPPLPS